METKFNSEVGTVTFRLKESNSNKPTLIQGIYLFKNTQTGFTTGIKISPQQWDKEEKKVLSGENKKDYNQKLNKYKISIPEMHSKFNEQYGRIPSKIEIKTIVQNAISSKELITVDKRKKNFDEIFSEFMEILELKKQKAIKLEQKPLHKSYISSFNVAYSDLKAFANDSNVILDLDTFDEKHCLYFQNWLIENKKTGSASTLKTRIKRIGHLLRWAFKKGYTENRSFMQDEFTVKVPPLSIITLTEPEIEILFKHDFTHNKRLEKVRDLFILGCHTSLRFSDVIRIVPNHIDFNAKKIHILTGKVTKKIEFSFFGFVEEILQKYNGEINTISLSTQNANLYLKEIFSIIPYFKNKKFKEEISTNNGVKFKETDYSKKISFHNSRTTFCTNRYIEGWDLLEVWQYSGHTNEQTFKAYIKPTPEHERIRKENIKQRNEKLLSIDLQTKQIEDLQKQLNELSKLVSEEKKEELAKIININQNAS